MRTRPRSNGSLPTRADLETAGIRIAVGVPLERTLPSLVFHSFWAIARRGWPLLEGGYGRIDVNRNRFARQLLNSDYTHLLMLDLDHLHPPDVVERLGRWMLEDPDRLVVSGLYFRRGEPFDPLAFVFGPEGGLHPLVEWPHGCIEVHAFGNGMLLVHRSVFERLEPPWWAYDYGRAHDDVYPTEDMYFCYLCREAGIKLWVDTTTTSSHIIENLVAEATWRAWLADHPEKVME
jgi:hypothetical protein